MKINPDRVYYNYGGKLPPVEINSGAPATVPPETEATHPKKITDTSMRDGAQDPRFALFPNEAKVEYFDLLHRLDNGTGRIDNVEVFIYQKRDIWTLEKLLEAGYEFPRVTTWTRATPKDIQLLAKVSQGRVKETGMLASSSDHHIFDKLKHRSKESAVEKYLAPIMTALEHGIRPRIHLEDVTKADIEGWVIPFIKRVLAETEGQACFRLCDTMGWGVPDPGAALPVGIPRLASTISRETGAELEFHGHNDFGLGTANSIAAWIYGCNRVNAGFAGFGERTGNTALEQMVAAMVRLYGDPGFDLGALTEMTRLFNDEVFPIASNAPITGRDIFTTQAGLHQGGVASQDAAPGGLIYLPYSSEVVGREQAELHRVGALSGMVGLVAILNDKLEAGGEEKRYSLTSKIILALYNKVTDQYDGDWNEESGHYENARRTFFEADELLEMAREIEGEN